MVFSFASIISTGFSTWSIVEVATASVNAGGDAIVVHDFDINVSYDFSFCKDGMVKDHVLLKQGIITINIGNIDSSKWSNFVANGQYTALAIFEETSNTDLLNTFVGKKPTSSDANSIGDNLSTNSKVIKNKITFSSSMSSLSLNYFVADNQYKTSKFHNNSPALSFSFVMEKNA